jgi:hypothetical protein
VQAIRSLNAGLRVRSEDIYIGVDSSKPPVARYTKPVDEKGVKEVFVFKRNLDTEGMVYHIGTAAGTQPFRNPAEQKPAAVVVTASSVDAPGSRPATAAVGRDLAKCYSKNMKNQWFQFEFPEHRIVPRRYMLRHIDSTPLPPPSSFFVLAMQLISCFPAHPQAKQMCCVRGALRRQMTARNGPL